MHCIGCSKIRAGQEKESSRLACALCHAPGRWRLTRGMLKFVKRNVGSRRRKGRYILVSLMRLEKTPEIRKLLNLSFIWCEFLVWNTFWGISPDSTTSRHVISDAVWFGATPQIFHVVSIQQDCWAWRHPFPILPCRIRWTRPRCWTSAAVEGTRVILYMIHAQETGPWVSKSSGSITLAFRRIVLPWLRQCHVQQYRTFFGAKSGGCGYVYAQMIIFCRSAKRSLLRTKMRFCTIFLDFVSQRKYTAKWRNSFHSVNEWFGTQLRSCSAFCEPRLSKRCGMKVQRDERSQKD